LLGGWLLELGSWRLVFLINLPVAMLVLLLSRHIPESKDEQAAQHTDFAGVVLAVLGLGALTFGLTERSWVYAGAGLVVLAGFVLNERRSRMPMLPLEVFRSRVFSATNLVTFLVYGAIGGLAFWLIVTLQVVAGLPPLEAGLSLLPLTVCMLLLSPLAGTVSDRFGPTAPMTVGPLVAALGVAALTRVDADTSFVLDVLLPTTVFGLGLAATVTPLTATVLAAVPDHQAGIASGVNNAVARTAGLLAVAVLPVVAGIGAHGFDDPGELLPAYRTVMWVCAGLLAVGGLLAAAFVRRAEEASQFECPKMHSDVAGPPIARVSQN
jgi:MFS family permease